METKLKNKNPKTEANCFSKLFFIWIIELYRKIATKHTIQISDLFKVLASDNSEQLTDKLEIKWNEEILKARSKQQKPKLIKAITATFLKDYLKFGIILFIQHVILRSSQPVILAYLIRLFNEKNNEISLSIAAGILTLVTFLIVITMHHANYGQAAIGMRIRIALSSLIYRKTLRLNRQALTETSTGQIVNLLSNDLTRFDLVVLTLNYIWILPFQITIVSYLCWIQIGFSSLVGILSIALLSLPVQGYLGKLTSFFRSKVAEKCDYRVTLMSEIIAGIQAIKMYAWEQPFQRFVNNARLQEIQALTTTSYLRGIYLSFMIFVERTALFLTLTCYVLNGNNFGADQVFSLSQFFNLLQLTMSVFYPLTISYGAEALVAIRRIENFLTLEEKNIHFSENQQAAVGLAMQNIQINNLLQDVNFRIPKGCLCAIIGPIASGKTTLLQLILNELKPDSGSIQHHGTISFASQEPWLFAASIRDNILFGSKYDKKFYKKVIKVCALEKDLHQLPQNDKTLVGERGASLSGGQQARINLARAVYRNADLYLLDDPLSAVDTHVGRHLFNECIVKFLRNKTRVLVTHQLQYLAKADVILLVKNGRVEIRNFQELQDVDLSSDKLDNEIPDVNILNLSESLQESIEIQNDYQAEETGLTEGSESLRKYITSSNSPCLLFVVICNLFICQILCSGCDFWVTFWTQETSAIDTYIALYIYSSLILSIIIISFIRSSFYFRLAMNASKNLHGMILENLLKAPMKFFHNYPAGRILNRFSKDMGSIDEILPKALLEAIQITLTMCGILVMVVISNCYMIVMIIILGYFFMKIRSWFVTVTRHVKHLEGIAKSPVFSHLNSSFNGLTTIRAFDAKSTLQKEFDHYQDIHTSVWFLLITSTSSFGLWLDLICLIFITTISFSFILLNYYKQIDGSFVGLAISQSLILTGMLQYGVRQSAEVVNQLTSVERILQYKNLEKESPFQTPQEILPAKNWPSQGFILFENVSLYYSSGKPAVLKNLNFEIQAGEKIGIVGRTGAGKSSLISSLFRLTPITGTIYIDGIDTKTIGLEDLRKKLSIIPQEPILFSASLRQNLDPFHEFSDQDIWKVLEQVELKESITNLDINLTKNNSSFSSGQKQLICLARAMLRKNKILILDEATANTDNKTDSTIQKMIRKKFQNCTVLTIAHRLHTIMDSDKIIVMDNGEIIEYDHPYLLMQKPQSVFFKMVLETGSKTSGRLEDIALDAFLHKH